MKVTAQGQNFTAAHPLLCHHLSHMSLVPSGICSRIWSLLLPQTLTEVCPKGLLRAAGKWRSLGDTPKLGGDGPAACVCVLCVPRMCRVDVQSSVVVVQSTSHVQLFATSWTVARQASLSHTISQSLPKFMSIASVMLSSYLIL